MRRILLALLASIFVGLPVPDEAQATAGLQTLVHRSAKAKYDFRKIHPCPATGKARGACPGYVIDHVVPLKRGGADDPSNMQWQTFDEAREKDKWEQVAATVQAMSQMRIVVYQGACVCSLSR